MADMLALLFIAAACVIFWLAWSGNYGAVAIALGKHMTAPKG